MPFVEIGRRLGALPPFQQQAPLGRLIRRPYHRALRWKSEHGGIARNVVGDVMRLRYPYSQFDEGFEGPVYEEIGRVVKPGMTVFDIGASYGLYTLASAQRVGDSGRVFAFEPGQATLAILRDHVGLNGLEQRVEIVPRAVSDEVGTVEFFEQGTSTLASMSKEAAARTVLRTGSTELETRRVETVTVDEFCREHGVSPDVLKIDVEGAEAKVLRGAHDFLGRRAGAILLELHPSILGLLGDSESDLFAMLDEAGWSHDVIYRRGEIDQHPEATLHYLCTPRQSS